MEKIVNDSSAVIPTTFSSKSETDNLELSELCLETGDSFYKKAKYKDALEVYIRILKFRFDGQECGQDVVIINQKIGKTMIKMSNCIDAHKYLAKSLEIKESLHDDDQIGISCILNDIGDAYLKEAKFPEAINYFQDSLGRIMKHYEENHQQVVACSNKLAEVLLWQAQYQEVLSLLDKAIKIGSSNELENKTELALSYYLKAWVYQRLGKFSESFAYNQKSLTLRLELYGEEGHPEVAKCYTRIGDLYLRQSNFNEALKYLNKSLDINLVVLGEYHPDVAGIYDSIGMIQRTLEDYSEAKKSYKKCLQIYSKSGRENHPDMAVTYCNMGNLYFDLNDFGTALNFYNQALDIRLQVFGENHPHTATSYDDIGWIYKRRDEYEKSCDNFSKALNIRIKCLGLNNSEVADSYDSLANLYRIMHEYDKALEHFIKSLKIRLGLKEENKLSIADSLYNFGLLFNEKKNKDLISNRLCNLKAHQVYIKVLGRSHQETLDAKNLLSHGDKLRAKLSMNDSII